MTSPDPDIQALGGQTRSTRRAQRAVPFLASAAGHVTLALVAVLVAGTVRLIQQRQERPPIVASFDALAYDPVQPLELPPVEMPEEAQTPPTAPAEAASLEQQLVGLELEPVGLLPDVSAQGAPSLPSPAAPATTTFAGLRTSNARSIVYVIDASGSLITALQVVLQELSRSLESLTDEQRFSVIFFQQDKALIVPPRRLLRATGPEKLRALEWIDRTIVPAGNSNPLPALEAALRMEPDVIFLLSDNITGAGQYEIDQAELLRRLDELNPRDRSGRRRTQINCIQFLYEDALDTLAIIAREHGSGDGGYKFLDREELGLSQP